MKMKISFFFLVSLLLLMGCSPKEPVQDFYDETLQSRYEGDYGLVVRLEENIIDLEAEVITVLYENPSNHSFTFGEHYSLERRNGEGWEKVEPESGMFFLDIGYMLESHDFRKQSFSLSLFKGLLTENVYRIHVEALDCYLEFRLQKGGAFPEKINYNEIYTQPITKLPTLTYDWQWYRYGDFARLFREKGRTIQGVIRPDDTGLIAILWTKTNAETTVIGKEIISCLSIVNRKTGQIKDVFKSPKICRSWIIQTEEGFSYEMDGKIKKIKLPQSWLE